MFDRVLNMLLMQEKKAVLQNFAIFIGNYLCWRLTISTKVFSCEYCEIFNNNYFEEHLRKVASVLSFTDRLCMTLHLPTLSDHRTFQKSTANKLHHTLLSEIL